MQHHLAATYLAFLTAVCILGQILISLVMQSTCKPVTPEELWCREIPNGINAGTPGCLPPFCPQVHLTQSHYWSKDVSEVLLHFGSCQLPSQAPSPERPQGEAVQQWGAQQGGAQPCFPRHCQQNQLFLACVLKICGMPQKESYFICHSLDCSNNLGLFSTLNDSRTSWIFGWILVTCRGLVFLFWHFPFTPYPCNRSRELSDRAVWDTDIEEMRVRHHDSKHFDSLLWLTPSLISGQLSPRCLNKDTAT